MQTKLFTRNRQVVTRPSKRQTKHHLVFQAHPLRIRDLFFTLSKKKKKKKVRKKEPAASFEKINETFHLQQIKT
jgi:hypothetical protein